MKEMEGKGIDFERYAMRKLFRRFVKNYDIGNVLEIPAKGEKAMPSIYSLAFAEAGCSVTLVNGFEKSKWAWDELSLDVDFIRVKSLVETNLPSASFDLVWNFLHLAKESDKSALLKEMTRLSKKYILFVSVNRFNPGFFSHRTVHRIAKIPWNHGDVKFMNIFHVRRFFQDHGLKVLQFGGVDTPPYPDSIGIRDMRLHRKNRDLNTLDWDSRTVHWMKSNSYPLKIKLLYLAEMLPLPLFLKIIYAHLFFVLAAKEGPES